MTYMNHNQPYADDYLQSILKSVKTIAMVGASPDKTKFSYGVLRVLHETGFDMIPVNPRLDVVEIRGIKVFNSLKEIDRPVDMVQVFRRAEDLPSVAHEAISIGAKVLWGQIGVKHQDAAKIAGDSETKFHLRKTLNISLFEFNSDVFVE